VPFVLDASTALSLILPDESASEVAKAVALAFVAGDRAQVPHLWLLEVGNALLMAERRRRIAVDSGSQLLEKLLVLPIQIAVQPPGDASWALEVLTIARAQQLTTYDSSYLHFARTRGLALASNDQPLVRAARALAIPLLGN
jgi:predicted nucleic acid-binding protein